MNDERGGLAVEGVEGFRGGDLIGEDASVLHLGDAVGKRKNPAVVGDNDHAAVGSAGAFFKQFQNASA